MKFVARLLIITLLFAPRAALSADEKPAPTLRVLQFNIWQEGTSVEDGVEGRPDPELSRNEWADRLRRGTPVADMGQLTPGDIEALNEAVAGDPDRLEHVPETQAQVAFWKWKWSAA